MFSSLRTRRTGTDATLARIHKLAIYQQFVPESQRRAVDRLASVSTSSLFNTHFPVLTKEYAYVKLAPLGHCSGRKVGSAEMQEEADWLHSFIVAFEKLYGRKPTLDDAERNDFAILVARDMDMSVGGARYYIRAATEGKSR